MPRKNKRKEDRIELFGEVFFSADSSSECDNLGATLNISNSGAAICSYQKIKEGTLLKIKGDGIWDDTKTAIAKWSQKIEDDIYKTGIVFPDAP